MQDIEQTDESLAAATDEVSAAILDRRRRNAGPLSQALRPITRTGGFYARSWGRYFDNGPHELPVARPTIGLASHAFRDELVLLGFRLQQAALDGKTVERVNREVTAALEFYGHKGWLDHPEGYFAAPPPLTDVTVKPVKNRGRNYERIFFDSDYEAHVGEPGRERWLGYTGNSREYALVFRHREPRPWLVCVHGTAMGRAAVDLTMFRAWHLYRDLGLNVVLPVLPMHGPRARGLPAGDGFPGANLLNTVHLVAQAVWDIRSLLSWIRSQQPEARIGLNGISLGGYLASIVASLDDDLTCAILGVPVANMIEVLGRHSGLRRDDPARETLRLVEPVGRMISPLAMTPRVPMRGRFIYAGVADRLVHPRDQVTRLWQHWEKPEIHWYQGGHIGFFGSRPVQRFIDDALVQSGLVDPSRTRKR
jgi:dienelactone hydrolase